MQRREFQPRRRTASIQRGRLSAVLVIAIAWVAFGATPVLAQTASADPGLDTIMKTVPAGFRRLANDPLPAGPMTAAQFNEVGNASVPVRDDNAVFYGATYDRPDGAALLFLGMSTVYRSDGQAWANSAMRGTLTDGQSFDVLIAGAKGVEGDFDGTPAAMITLARNGRGFAVLVIGETARQDTLRFAEVVGDAAQSTPVRADAEPQVSGAAVVVLLVVFLAIVIIAVIVLGRVLRKRSRRRAAQLNASMGPFSNPWGTNRGYPTVFPPPTQTVPPPPPSRPPPPPWAR
jgi:hypothetical protein